MGKSAKELKEILDKEHELYSVGYVECLGHLADYDTRFDVDDVYRLWVFDYKGEKVVLSDDGNQFYSYHSTYEEMVEKLNK